MNMVLHYLKFDLRRWWWLVLAMWLAAAGYVWTMSRIGGVLSPDFQSSWRAFRSLSDQLHFACLMAAVAGAALCYLAGSADSRVSGQAWTMTRPMNYRLLSAARALMLSAGVCLPLSLAHLCSLAVMEFSSTTILQESLRATLLFGLATVALWLFGMAGRNPAGIVLVVIGTLLAGVLLFMPGRTLHYHGGSYHADIFERAEVWPVTVTRGENQPETGDLQHVSLSDPGEPRGMDVRSFRFRAFSWRASAAEKWSPWMEITSPARDRSHGGNDQPYAWNFELYPVIQKLASGLSKGDLRLGVELYVETDRAEILPIADYIPSDGEAWTMKAATEQAEDGSFQAFAAVRMFPFRSAPVEDVDLLLNTPSGYTSLDHNNIGRSGFSLPLMSLRYYTWEKVSLKSQPSVATHLRIRRIPQESPVFKVLELTGVTLPACPPAAEPPVPTPAVSPASPGTWQWETLSQMPQPLTQGGEPGIPGAGASRGEVAAYLSYLTSTEREYRQGPWGWPESKRREFAALVPQWLPMFLQAIVVAGERRGVVIERALQEGTPEERRAELIQRIPESPLLARIAIQRGWLAEATPQLTELFKKAGGIPEALDLLLFQLRDPAFHPWLRAKFRSTVPMIRHWQSDPALAKDLPALLAEARQRIQSAPPNTNQVDGDELNGLLSTGDTAALDQTIRCYFNNPNGSYWPRDYITRWLRTADDRRLPYDDKHLQPLLKGLTAADFAWNAARGLFLQKPKPTQP